MSDMTAKVRGFRGCASADILLKGVTLVAGLNGQGKTSLLQAVGAAAANAPIPFFKSDRPDSTLLAKKDAAQLVNDSGDIGGIRLISDDGAIQLGWPSLDYETKGAPPQISRVAAGLITPLDMPDAPRAAFFQSLLQTTPTSAELVAALTDKKQVGLVPKKDDELNDQPIIDELVDKVEIGTYDAAHDFVKTNGAKLKGRWEEATGVRFGANKDDWTPEGWTDDLDEVSVEALEEQLASHKQARDDLFGQAAVDDAKMTELRENAQREQTTHALYEDAMRKAVGASKTVQEARGLLKGKAAVPRLTACCECAALLQITVGEDGSVSVAPSAMTKEQADKALAELKEAQEELEAAEQYLRECAATEADARATWNRYKGAAKLLVDAEGRTGESDGYAAAVTKVTALERAIAMVKTKRRATSLHAKILLHNKIIEVLAPTGLRQKKLVEAIAAFNTLLEGICEGAGFDPVVLHQDLTATYAGRSYFLSSASQQWRCRVAVQIATAVKEEAPLTIIDGADILDGEAREGFLHALIQIAKPVAEAGVDMKFLVAMTLPRQESMPPLGKINKGNSYWMEAGTIATSA